MEKWSCMRSGHCCSVVGGVTMTPEEQGIVMAHPAAQTRTLQWDPDPAEGFVRLIGSPACPFLGYEDSGLATCAIRESRPYNCRRWGCFRESTDEPYDVRSVNARILGNRDIYRQAVLLQRKSQRWARQYGWKEAT